MSFNKIYSGMENAPQAIDENFNNSYPKDEILTEETAAALGVTEDNPTPEMAFKKLAEFDPNKKTVKCIKLKGPGGSYGEGIWLYVSQSGVIGLTINLEFNTVITSGDVISEIPLGDFQFSKTEFPVAGFTDWSQKGYVPCLVSISEDGVISVKILTSATAIRSIYGTSLINTGVK